VESLDETTAGQRTFFFFFIALEPRVECYNNL